MRRGREGAKEAAYMTTTASFAATPTTLSVTIAGAIPLPAAGAADAAADVAAADVDPASSISGAAVRQPAAAVRRAAADALAAAVPSADAGAAVFGAALLDAASAHADAASVALPGPPAADAAKGGRPGAPPLAAAALIPSRGGGGRQRVTAGAAPAAVARAGSGGARGKPLAGSPSRRHPTPPATPRRTCMARREGDEGVATEPASGAMARTRPGAPWSRSPSPGRAQGSGEALVGRPAFLRSRAAHCSDGNTKTCQASHRAVVSNPLPWKPNTNDLQLPPPPPPTPEDQQPRSPLTVSIARNSATNSHPASIKPTQEPPPPPPPKPRKAEGRSDVRFSRKQKQGLVMFSLKALLCDM